MYVMDTGNYRITAYTKDGNYVAEHVCPSTVLASARACQHPFPTRIPRKKVHFIVTAGLD